MLYPTGYKAESRIPNNNLLLAVSYASSVIFINASLAFAML